MIQAIWFPLENGGTHPSFPHCKGKGRGNRLFVSKLWVAVINAQDKQLKKRTGLFWFVVTDVPVSGGSANFSPMSSTGNPAFNT